MYKMNKEITLKQLEYDLYHSEKKKEKQKERQANLEEYFKISYCKKEDI